MDAVRRIGDRTFRAHDDGFDRVEREMIDEVQEARTGAIGGGRMHHVQHAQGSAVMRWSLTRRGSREAPRHAL